MENQAQSSDNAVNDATKELFERIQAGDSELVRQLIGSSDVSVNCVDEHGMTPLQNAAFKGNLPLCELLLAHGADVNANHHENGYTTLMFGALSGNTEVTRLMLQAGAKTSPTNSVGRTASQMAAFVGQHACVSIMNNFFNREQLDYYTITRGFEKEPKLPPNLAPSLHKMILMHNLNPVRLVQYLKNNENLLNEACKIANVLELISEKEMKSKATNDVLAVKMHYLSNVIRQCHKWNMEKTNGVDEFIKFLLRARENDGTRVNMEKLLREIIREFPFHESELFVQIVRNLTDVKIGDEPTALGILTQAVNGARSLEVVNPCSTCGEAKASKKCSACKQVNYCDAVCQKLEWFTHKKQCKRIAEEHKERQEFIQKENVRHKLEEEKKKLEEEKTRLEEEEKRLEEEQKEAQKETITNGTEDKEDSPSPPKDSGTTESKTIEETTQKLEDTTVS
ncbi:ankyrin repeat and MYND domain-containing protein 2 [Strongylocentrotus purpuratus]|uniref:MYND-type domain-containing protein n=1 Tax=Strongylocentrotus purpuratus TaxID=7668 RepID=A0A7M7RDG9_STRPU|nr:ankyrin repeat and MYND domain-containing protein 2 [Strongylocentrotus purpuratus]|eukprot:XP_791789.3 PREDICTED: ankyrin repeat and MYND domain-containing protein 2 [Strongylocentrotus purpuratus]